jgi:hypothetical protein
MTPPHDFPWHAWGEAVFDQARREGKPVLLHIGATWCHWCHVMDEGSYTHPGVARLIREHFLAVRVDTDHRPDINERYNQGGWPTFAVLDAEGEVLLGRTYVPAGELHSLLSGLAQSDGRWSIAPERPRHEAPAPPGASEVYAELVRAFDRYHGGFGDLEKFPHVQALDWLLDRTLAGEEGGEMLDRTLDAMVHRGLYDHEEGGFFRYCTQDDWTVPHYEKLLIDNMRLVHVLLRGSRARRRPDWRTAAEGALNWALATLWDDAREAFGGSQDADEGYYANPRTRRRGPPPVDGTVYAGWNGAAAEALVTAAAVLERPGLLGLARRVGTTLLDEHVEADGRVVRLGSGAATEGERIAGLLEDQVEVAGGFLALAGALGDGPWLDAARRCLEWAWSRLPAPEGGCLDREAGGIGRLKVGRRPMLANAGLAVVSWRLGARLDGATWLPRAREAAGAAMIEAADWGFMGAAAAGATARVAAEPVLLKVRDDRLLSALLADPRPRLVVVAVSGEAAADVPEGAVLACTSTACARPARSLVEVEAALEMLRRS